MPMVANSIAAPRVSVLSDRQLIRWYREYNSKWFSAELPDEIDILYAPVEGCFADVTPCRAQEFILRIDPRFAHDSATVRMTLLHEMVHIKVQPYRWHGVRFQEEMQRLANAGAFKGLW